MEEILPTRRVWDSSDLVVQLEPGGKFVDDWLRLYDHLGRLRDFGFSNGVWELHSSTLNEVS
jgi:hypothetical protein